MGLKKLVKKWSPIGLQGRLHNKLGLGSISPASMLYDKLNFSDRDERIADEEKRKKRAGIQVQGLKAGGRISCRGAGKALRGTKFRNR